MNEFLADTNSFSKPERNKNPLKIIAKMFVATVIVFTILAIAYFLIIWPLRKDSHPLLEFNNLAMVDSIMNRQDDLMKGLPCAGGNRVISWKINQNKYILNGFNLDSGTVTKDSILRAWNLSKSDYEFLKQSSKVIYSLGISEGCVISGNLGFLYQYEPGFDADFNYIFLKNKLIGRNKEMIDFACPTILAENEKMTLRN